MLNNFMLFVSCYNFMNLSNLIESTISELKLH